MKLCTKCVHEKICRAARFLGSANECENYLERKDLTNERECGIMPTDEIIKWLESVKGFIEWDMPLDAVVAIEEAIKVLEKEG